MSTETTSKGKLTLMVNAGSLTTHVVRHPAKINWNAIVITGLVLAVIALVVIR